MDKTLRITLGILAHVDAGKTTLSEALLYKTGELRKIGRVDHGDSFLDDSEIERNRGITVFSRQARFSISGPERTCEVTLIDTPGHVDFAAEMERALSVIDHALLVVSGSEGVQAHTKTLFRMLRERQIPVFIFVNKMDIAVRSPEDIVSDMASELGAPITDFSPRRRIGAGGMLSDDFIDDITLHSPDLAEKVLEREAPEGEDILTDDEITDEIEECRIVPCIFGSALKLEGIEDLLDVLGRYTREPEYGSEFGARIYKIANAEDGSRLAFAKITGGTLKVRDTVIGHSASVKHSAVSDEQPEADWESKVSQIRLYSGSRFTSADMVSAGSVCALLGLPEAGAGDGLGAESPAEEASLKAFMVYTVSGPEGMDPYLVMKDIEKLSREDPALNASWRQDTGEIEIRLMGQVQLEVISQMIHDRYGYDVTFGTGKVLYLETVSDTFEGVGHFEPLRHYAEVHLIISPGERGSGVVINSITPEDELARNWQRLIMTHIEEKEHAGVLTGAPLTDVMITLAAGRAHDKHTSGGDFREATYRAVRNALMQAREAGAAVLLEPWYEYDIELPSQHVGRAMTDIKQMGGTQEGLEQNGDVSALRGRVPASCIADYQQTLTGYTSGLGRLGCSLAGYDVCHDTEAVIEASGYDPERDTENPADSVFVSHGGTDIVKWDEVPAHMHIAGVLRNLRGESDTGSGADPSYTPGSGILRGDEKERRAAAEKELRLIFERTYGPADKKRGKEARENRFGISKPEKTPQQQEADEKRNEEIREKHLRKERTAGAEQERPLYLVDGYNLIYADEYLKDLSKRDMGAARDQLLERLCNYSAYKGYETAVIFDAYNVAGGEGYEEDHLGLRVIYTAQDEPADIRIGLITNSVRNRQVYVVSSDVLVQQDSFEHGALRISSKEFIRMISQAEEEIRSSL